MTMQPLREYSPPQRLDTTRPGPADGQFAPSRRVRTYDDPRLHPAQTSTIQLSTATTLITTTDLVRIAEDYATLQHLSDGRIDLMMGRGNTGRVHPWFGKNIRDAHLRAEPVNQPSHNVVS